MRNPFKNNAEEPTPKAPAPQASADGFNPTEARDQIFSALAPRLGNEWAKAKRVDFDLHVSADPVNGVEAGWACLCAGLIEMVDHVFELLGGGDPGSIGEAVSNGPQSDGPVSPFTTFRKDG